MLENVRIASPISGFTRRLACDYELAGVALKQGSRVGQRPARLRRFSPGQAGDGSLLGAMLAPVTRVRTWDARRLMNDTLRGIGALRASFE